MTTFEILP